MNPGLTNPATPQDLAAILPKVLDAPRDGGEIRLLCARPKPNARSFPSTLVFSRAAGVIGDFEMSRPWLTLPDGSPDPQIQVSIMSWHVLQTVWRQRDEVAHPGDNIAVDMNITMQNLPAGTLLAVGSAVLRISQQPNAGCAKWKVRYGRAAFDWTSATANLPLRLRGMFCAIEQDGEVKLGDTIRRL